MFRPQQQRSNSSGHSMDGDRASRNTNQPQSSRRRWQLSARRWEYFVPRDGIDREVISADICRYLGNDALVRPGMHENPQNGQVTLGYYIISSRNLTSIMIEDLKADSARWENERRARGNIAVGSYLHSETHQSRQHYGPSEIVPQPVPDSRPDQVQTTTPLDTRSRISGSTQHLALLQDTMDALEVDLESLTDVDSVFSAASSALTSGSSTASGPVMGIISQIQKLAEVLLNDLEFKNICVVAASRVDRPKWRAHLKGFLGEYGTALKIEASDFLEIQVANFVKKKAGSISDAIYERITSPREIFKLDKDSKIQLEDYLAHVSRIPREGTSSSKGDDESDPGEEGELQFELLNRLQDFLRQGDAFRGLIQSLKLWLHLSRDSKEPVQTPSSPEERLQQAAEQVEPADPQPRYVSWVTEQLRSRASHDLSLHFASTQPWSVANRVKGAIEDFFGCGFDWWPLAPRMKEVPNDKTRLTWNCECDRKRHLDVPSHLVPAIMQKALAPASSTSPQPTDTLPLAVPQKSLTSPEEEAGSGNMSGFEMRRLNASSARGSGISPDRTLRLNPDRENDPNPTEKLFAFFVVAANPHVGTRNYLAQTQVQVRARDTASEAAFSAAQTQRPQLPVCNDDSFFQWIQQEYSALRGWFGTNLSFRRYSHCDFYQFKRWDAHMYSLVEQHSFPDSEHSSTYRSSYRYDPQPMAPMPPITEDEFYHRYYTCYSPSTWHKLLPFHSCRRRCGSCVKLDYLPLRLASLQCDDTANEYFWGIYAVTEISALWVLLYATILVVLPTSIPSIVFFFMWLFAWGHEGDLQDAAVPLSLSISLASLFLGYVALDAWTAGGRRARSKLKVE